MKKYFIVIFVLLLISVFAAGFRSALLPLSEGSSEEVQFSIKKGDGSKDIALNLEKEDLIKWAPAFRAYVIFKGMAGNLKAGEYLLSPSMSVPEIAEKIIKGEVLKISVTIPEGFTVRQIEERLGVQLPGENLEGFLFPDTYQFSFGFFGEEAVEKMRANFEKKLTQDLREEIARQNKTVLEIITMASLIEKEVRASEDKRIVSGLLWKRLEAGMLLQVDATIAYILEAEGWGFDEMRREIALSRGIDSPYNTYKYPGLPPGPISNPGIESITAAVYPVESDYWYYLSTPEGETVFSKTLEEHNSARATYLRQAY